MQLTPIINNLEKLKRSLIETQFQHKEMNIKNNQKSQKV